MEAEEGKRVKISFVCKLEDGTIYDIAEDDTLEFVVGQGNTLPTLEMAVLGMKPGDHRVIRVPAAEAEEYPFEPDEAPTEGHFPAGAGRGTGFGYDFGPEEGGDVYLTMPAAPTRPLRTRRRVASDLIFDVEMVSVEEADLELGE